MKIVPSIFRTLKANLSFSPKKMQIIPALMEPDNVNLSNYFCLKAKNKNHNLMCFKDFFGHRGSKKVKKEFIRALKNKEGFF